MGTLTFFMLPRIQFTFSTLKYYQKKSDRQVCKPGLQWKLRSSLNAHYGWWWRQQNSIPCRLLDRIRGIRTWPKHTSLISIRMVLDKCNNYSFAVSYIPGTGPARLIESSCVQDRLEPDGNGLYRPSHLFYFLENDEGPSSIAPSHQSSLHWNHHSTHIRGIIWLQLCSTIIVGLCRIN